MRPEIEALKKFANKPVSKARLDAFRAALSNATTLLGLLAPKPGDEDAAAEFEHAHSEIENSLNDLEAACDDLESAEEKDEREAAQETITESLEGALKLFEEIMSVAVVTPPDDPQVIADFNAFIAALKSTPKDQLGSLREAWMNGAPSEEENQKRKAYFAKIFKLK